MFQCFLDQKSDLHSQSGMTLVITLLLMLTLTLMASAITFVVNNHSDLTSSVTQRPLAMDTADSCVDRAVEWMQTSVGKAWLDQEVVGATPATDNYGIGANQDLAAAGNPLHGQTALVTDTAKSTGDTRTLKFKNRVGLASCTSVQVTVVKRTTDTVTETGVGAEAGTEAAYDSVGDSSSSTYTVVIVSEGIFNAPTNADGTAIDQTKWTQNASKGKIEVVLTYQL
tara:strand:- start:843 stop:1520 length:678 start_codon:yes stop_codon:yes gene_type:complete